MSEQFPFGSLYIFILRWFDHLASITKRDAIASITKALVGAFYVFSLWTPREVGFASVIGLALGCLTYTEPWHWSTKSCKLMCLWLQHWRKECWSGYARLSGQIICLLALTCSVPYEHVSRVWVRLARLLNCWKRGSCSSSLLWLRLRVWLLLLPPRRCLWCLRYLCHWLMLTLCWPLLARLRKRMLMCLRSLKLCAPNSCGSRQKTKKGCCYWANAWSASMAWKLALRKYRSFAAKRKSETLRILQCSWILRPALPPPLAWRRRRRLQRPLVKELEGLTTKQVVAVPLSRTMCWSAYWARCARACPRIWLVLCTGKQANKTRGITYYRLR
jgi:hypothetical protein